MDLCSLIPWEPPGWKESSLDFQTRVKSLIFPSANDSVTIHQQTSEVLTTEATFMIILILIFVILALVGTFITASEFLCEGKTKEKYSSYEPEKKAIVTLNGNLNKKIHPSSKVWKKDVRSFLKCFCLVKNVKTVLMADSSKEQFPFLRGIRFLASNWFMLFHTNFFYVLTLKNWDSLKPWMGSMGAHIVLNSLFSSDVFFVLSGFLNAHSFSKDYVRNNGKISISYFYIKRFVRIVPVYMMVLGFYTLLLSYTCSGSKGLGFTINPVCQEFWGWNILFINNFQPTFHQCMSWCWYLATEMQFYIVSPIFMILILRRPSFGYFLTNLCIFLSCFASFFITKHCNLLDGFSRFVQHIDNLEPIFVRASLYYEKVYVLPHTRIHSYLIGILLGMYIHKRRNGSKNRKMNQVILCCGWIASVVLMSGCIMAQYNRKESTIEIALYNGVKHLFFSLGLSWVILVCENGQGGFVNRILSWKIFYPFFKLSYSAYLVHMVILMRFYKIAPQLQEFSISYLARLCVYIYFWTFFFAFIASVLVELPVGNLLDFFRNRNTSPKTKLVHKKD